MPLYQAAVAVLYRLFGPHEILGRLLAAACSVLAALVLSRAVREARDGAEARAAGLLALLAPITVLYGRAYLLDPLNVLLTLVFFWLGTRAILGTRARPGELAVLALAGGLAATVKPLHLVPFLAALTWLALARASEEGRLDPRRLARLAATLAIPAIVTVAAAVAWRRHAAAANAAAGHPDLDLTNQLWWYCFSPAQFRDPAIWLQLAKRLVVTLGLAGIVLGPVGLATARELLRAPRGSPDRRIAEMSLGLALGSALYLVGFLNLNVVHQYYQLPVAFAMAPLFALAATRSPLARRPRALTAAVLLSTVATVAIVAASRRDLGFPYDRDQIEEGREFRAVVPEGRPLTFFVPGEDRHDGPMFLYWADTWGYFEVSPDPATIEARRREGVRLVVIERGPRSAGVAERLPAGTARLGGGPHMDVYRLPE
jgi:4-amino-4-deoxy-L-arabinose transferase-like glycosyltransferase